MERLQKELTRHIDIELLDFLGYEISNNDMNGIIENIMKTIDHEINNYIERNERNE